MKIVFNRSAVCAAVSPMMYAVASNPTIPAVEGILIEAKYPDTCVMTTFDMDKGIRLTVEAQVIEEGSFIINAQKFIQTLRVMAGEEVTLTVDNKMVACIFSGRSSHKMSALAGSDFPSIPDLCSDRSFIVGQAVVKKMMNQVAFAMGVKDTRMVLNGTFFKITDNNLLMVSCDSSKLAKCSAKTELVNKNTNGNDHLEYSFIVPCKTMNELNKLVSDEEDALMQIYVTRKHIVFVIGEITFFSRLIDGEYIDYDRIIMANHKIHVKIDRREMISALERAALVTEEKIAHSVRCHVKLDFSEDLLKITAVSSAGSIYDEVAMEKDGEDILIAFNNRYLMDSLRSCSEDELVLSLSSPWTTMNIEPIRCFESRKNGEEQEEEEIFMLLPIRMKD